MRPKWSHFRALCADDSLCQVIKGALQNKVKIMTKSSSIDLVTQTDHKVEKIIILSVKEKFPTHRYVSFFYVLFPRLSVDHLYWRGVSSSWSGLCVYKQLQMDHQPCGWHHKLFTLVRSLYSHYYLLELCNI